MDQGVRDNGGGDGMHDVRGLIREALDEYARREVSKAEPAYKAELVEDVVIRFSIASK